MADALLWHRIQFAFTITFHYLFPQLAMGLVVLIVAWKSVAVFRVSPVSVGRCARMP
jgi:cytochrome d ubiquinol oxidase subunit I